MKLVMVFGGAWCYEGVFYKITVAIDIGECISLIVTKLDTLKTRTTRIPLVVFYQGISISFNTEAGDFTYYSLSVLDTGHSTNIHSFMHSMLRTIVEY
jgi:hypothetical protein